MTAEGTVGAPTCFVQILIWVILFSRSILNVLLCLKFDCINACFRAGSFSLGNILRVTPLDPLKKRHIFQQEQNSHRFKYLYGGAFHSYALNSPTDIIS
jgi:hypothetical protein